MNIAAAAASNNANSPLPANLVNGPATSGSAASTGPRHRPRAPIR
jgi:hypothetical protein